MNKYNANQLGAIVRKRRLELGLTLKQLAAAVDLDDGYLSKLESGTYIKPNPTALVTIAQALDIPFEDLYGAIGYESPTRLPSFAPYLRAKYSLPPEAVADLERYFELLRNFYSIPQDHPVFPPKPKTDEVPEDRRAA